MEAILRCRFVYIYPHPGACTLRRNLSLYSWCVMAAKVLSPFLLKAITPSIWSYLSSSLWGQPQQDLKVFACQSFSLCTTFGSLWLGTPAPELIFKVSLFMKSILCFGFVHSAVSSHTGLSRLNLIQVSVSWYQHRDSQSRKITWPSHNWKVTHLLLLIRHLFTALPSPHDPTSLPSSSYSDHALIVQRDAFFILDHEILKHLRNICSAMQT